MNGRWVDAAGTAHRRAGPDARIVSLVPSITELLVDLGLADRLVGRTGFCIHPREVVRSIVKVGGTKSVRLDRLKALAPTHVVVNVDENELQTVETIRDWGIEVVVTHPLSPEDNVALYRLVGGVFDREARAAALEAALNVELAACSRLRVPRERVLYLVWKDPWMTIARDTYIARTLARVGWDVPHPEGGWSGAARYPVVEDVAAAAAAVDRVLLPSEPWRFRARDADALRREAPGMRVDLIDGELTSWYGSRAVRGLRYLRTLRTAGTDAPARGDGPARDAG